MPASRKKIQRSNQEYYCDTYSIAGNFRRWNFIFSIFTVLLWGIALFIYKQFSLIYRYQIEAGKQDLGSQEVMDWVKDKAMQELWDMRFVVIAVFTFAMCLFILLLYRCFKSYNLYKYKSFMWIPGILYLACFVYIGISCFSDGFASGVFMTVVNFIPLFGAFKALLPSEMKAPFDYFIDVFEFMVQWIVKKK